LKHTMGSHGRACAGLSLYPAGVEKRILTIDIKKEKMHIYHRKRARNKPKKPQ